MNSLPAQVGNGLLLQYADDITIICAGVTPAAVQATMCSQLLLIKQWILQSKMEINFKKSWFKSPIAPCNPHILLYLLVVMFYK